jgi:hypothetical protein
MLFTSLEFFQVHQELLIGWSMGGGENDRMVVTMVAVGKRERGAA